MSRIAILGGGSWGTGLAVVFSSSRRQHDIRLWVRDPSLAESLEQERENKKYLPGVSIPACVKASTKLEEVLHEAQIVVGAVPSAHTRSIFALALPNVSRDAAFLSATKGLEPATHLRMSEVISQVINARFVPSVAVLSGAMKNVMAIAAGACQGLGLGANSVAALITRGLAEMSRLVMALGGKPETLSGLAGMGDLILTCYGTQSRNRHVGFELGQGRSLTEILAGMTMVAEGVGTTAALLALARENRIELPITQQVHSILHLGIPPRPLLKSMCCDGG